MFKKLLVGFLMFLSLLLTSNSAQALPDEQQVERCKFEAMVTQMGFQARLSMDKEEFSLKVEELRSNAAKDPEITKEQIDIAVRSLKQGYAGMSSQKASNACMNRKQT